MRSPNRSCNLAGLNYWMYSKFSHLKIKERNAIWCYIYKIVLYMKWLYHLINIKFKFQIGPNHEKNNWLTVTSNVMNIIVQSLVLTIRYSARLSCRLWGCKNQVLPACNCCMKPVPGLWSWDHFRTLLRINWREQNL